MAMRYFDKWREVLCEVEVHKIKLDVGKHIIAKVFRAESFV